MNPSDHKDPESKPEGSRERRYKRRARNIFIHKPMQREFTLVMIAALMISSLAIGFVIHSTIREAAFGGGFHFGKINPYDVLAQVSHELMLRVISILFLTLFMMGVFGVFFLHRIAGPVYRFRQILLRLNDGMIPSPIKLREGDFFAEVAVEINRLLSQFEFDRKKWALLRDKIDKMLANHPPESVVQWAREVKELAARRVNH